MDASGSHVTNQQEDSPLDDREDAPVGNDGQDDDHDPIKNRHQNRKRKRRNQSLREMVYYCVLYVHMPAHTHAHTHTHLCEYVSDYKCTYCSCFVQRNYHNRGKKIHLLDQPCHLMPIVFHMLHHQKSIALTTSLHTTTTKQDLLMSLDHMIHQLYPILHIQQLHKLTRNNIR